MKNGHTHASTCPICSKPIFLPMLHQEPDRTLPFAKKPVHPSLGAEVLSDTFAASTRSAVARTEPPQVL